MHFLTTSSVLSGDIKMSPQSASSVVEEGSRSEEYCSMEMLEAEKFGFHLRMFGKYWELMEFKVSVVIRQVDSPVGMVNPWCSLQKDGQMASWLPSVPL